MTTSARTSWTGRFLAEVMSATFPACSAGIKTLGVVKKRKERAPVALEGERVPLLRGQQSSYFSGTGWMSVMWIVLLALSRLPFTLTCLPSNCLALS